MKLLGFIRANTLVPYQIYDAVELCFMFSAEAFTIHWGPLHKRHGLHT